MIEKELQLATCSFSTLKKFHIHLLRISIKPVKKGRKVLFGIKITREGEIVRVQEHRKTKFTRITA